MSLCNACVTGVIHEGEPRGKFETIGGVECYVGTPEGDYAKDKVLLFCADIFGNHINNQLLVDSFARSGLYTVSPDYFNGDPIPSSVLTEGFASINLPEWLSNHGKDVTRAPLDKIISALKENGITSFGATGYCFGGPPVFDLAGEGITNVSVASHPSLLEEKDLQIYFDKAKVPLLLNTCEIDEKFPEALQKAADRIFGDGKFAPGYRRTYWDGCEHGFAVRGDLSDKKVKAGLEGSFKATVEWVRKYL